MSDHNRIHQQQPLKPPIACPRCGGPLTGPYFLAYYRNTAASNRRIAAKITFLPASQP